MLSCVPLFVTPRTVAHQVFLSFTSSLRSLLKLRSIEFVMPSNYLILCCSLLLLPSLFPSIRSFPMSWLFTSGRQGEGNGTPLQYSCLKNPMDRGARCNAVHEVARSWTRLSDFTFTFHFHTSEEEMATHSSVLAWRIPGTGEPGGLPSVGSHRGGHD